jgi:hypothetical protein
LPDLTQEIIERIIKHLKAKKKISITTDINGMLMWQYEGKPLIALNKAENKIYTTQHELNRFGIDDCQKQAAYVLQILRKYGYAKFTQFVVNLDHYRLGRTPEERKLTYQALERLAKKNEGHSLYVPKRQPTRKQINAQKGYQQRRENL